MPRYIGPYTIIEVIGPRNEEGEVTTVTACKLNLRNAMKIHPVFHVSLLKPYKSDGKSHSTGPLVFDSDGSPTWEAELIIKERSARGRRPGRGQTKMEYLIRWKGHGPEQDSWEKAASIQEAAPQVVDRWKSRQDRDERAKERAGKRTKM